MPVGSESRQGSLCRGPWLGGRHAVFAGVPYDAPGAADGRGARRFSERFLLAVTRRYRVTA